MNQPKNPPRWSTTTGIALGRLVVRHVYGPNDYSDESFADEIAQYLKGCHRRVVPLDLATIKALLKEGDPDQLCALAIEMMCIYLQMCRGAVYQDGEICGNYIVHHSFFWQSAKKDVLAPKGYIA